MFSSNASAVSGDVNYIEDVFSTYLYTGTGSSLPIVNNIDLATKGGLTWIKNRSTPTNTGDHRLYDTTRGANNALFSNTTDSSTALTSSLTSFDSTGFTLGTNARVNESAVTWASWTFRKQPKFFDVVTWTGTGGSGNRQIAHSLGSVPGFITIKDTGAASSWRCYHRSLGANNAIALNSTAAASGDSTFPADPTSTYFEINAGGVYNTSGNTYVAYIYAHDAGGFGLTGTDNVITCGSYTGTGADPGPNVNLGFEPQWLLVKRASGGTSNWVMGDVMRGLHGYSGDDGAQLYPNLSNAEAAAFQFNITSTGFRVRGAGTTTNNSGDTYIYIAIRRGPMKVPTDATKVYASTGTVTSAGPVTGFVTDVEILGQLAGADKFYLSPRLTGTNIMYTTSTNAESLQSNVVWDRMNGAWNSAISGYFLWGFQRAPGFCDVVCYPGNGSTQSISHNLAAVPELMIVKNRTSGAYNWAVYSSALGNAYHLFLNTTDSSQATGGQWNSTTPTSSVFYVGANNQVNQSGSYHVAYLFATCPGVSKVGSYTGTATTKQVNCGFAAGARFVLIKRTDSTGDWYLYDSTRGIVAGNDPYVLLNSTAAEVTSTDYVDTYAAGFELSSTAPAALNASGGTYIFLAIA